VAGLVPWAKAGIIVKDGMRQGSQYAALMVTGSHGLRFQHDYQHDVAGRAGGVSEQSPRWLRLTRSGDKITGSESADGRNWHTVATAVLHRLPDTVQVGLFATSPGDLTLRKIGLGGAIEEVRFTQAVGVFDTVTVEGGTPGEFDSDSVGEMNHTDWEKYRNASGAVEKGGVITISGTGDIGPIGEEGRRAVENTLPGLPFALIITVVAAVRYGAGTDRRSGDRRPRGGTRAQRRPRLRARRVAAPRLGSDRCRGIADRSALCRHSIPAVARRGLRMVAAPHPSRRLRGQADNGGVSAGDGALRAISRILSASRMGRPHPALRVHGSHPPDSRRP
jgi:hypothetical protein